MAPKKRRDIVFRFRLQLLEIEPPIWRCLEVPANFTFLQLHRVIQAALGWEDCHLHLFQAAKTRIGDPNPEWDLDCLDEGELRLGEFPLHLGNELEYEYDFGDGWRHLLLLEGMFLAEEGVSYPRCTAGEGACPPEDCGGPFGYAGMLEALADPTHPEHELWTGWLAEAFDPDAFDLEATNAQLAKAFKRRSAGRAKRN